MFWLVDGSVGCFLGWWVVDGWVDGWLVDKWC